MAQMPALFASAANSMRHGYPPYGSPGRLLGNILALVVIGWFVLHLLAWLGWIASPGCQLGRGLAVVLSSRLLETLGILCLVAWGLTLFTKHVALLWALVILFAWSWAAGDLPALLATC